MLDLINLESIADNCCAKENCFDLPSQFESLRLIIDELIQSGSANSRKKVLSAILTLEIRGSTNSEKKELRRIQRISCVWAEIAMPEICCYERLKLQCKLDFFFLDKIVDWKGQVSVVLIKCNSLDH